MKKYLFLLFLFLAIVRASSGQTVYNLSLFYSIPPTSGCNGVLAIDGSPLLNNCLPFTYTIDCGPVPGNCSWDGDTLFYTSVCSSPCNYLFVDAGGNPCASLRTAIADPFQNDFKIYFDNVSQRLRITAPTVGVTSISIFNLEGRMIKKAFKDGSMNDVAIDFTSVPPGVYFYYIKTRDHVLRGKILKPE